MNITFDYNLNNIELNQLSVTFLKDGNLKHIDSVVVPKNEDGTINNIELNFRINALYQHVLSKQEVINWIQV